MIVIDENGSLNNLLEKLEAEIDFGHMKLDLATFELSNGLNEELVIIDLNVYNQLSKILKDKLNSCAGVILYNPDGVKPLVLLENVFGVFNGKNDLDVFLNQIHFFERQFKLNSILKSQLITINKELAELSTGVESQIVRVKKAYEQNIPKRLEKFQGVQILSKYSAGENLGGEFFDMFSVENKVFLLMSSVSSYLASSSVLEYFADTKTQGVISRDAEKELIEKITSEVERMNGDRKNKIELNISTFIIDLGTLEVSGHSWGEFQVLSSNPEHNKFFHNNEYTDFESSAFEFKLDRGERFIINSPGFIRNWSQTNSNMLIEELLVSSKMKSLEVLDEAFFNIKKNSADGFLPYDASAVLVEVQENVILKV